MLGRLVNFLLGVMIVGGGECWSVVNVVRFPQPTPRRGDGSGDQRPEKVGMKLFRFLQVSDAH